MQIKWNGDESIVYVTEEDELIPFYFQKEIEPEGEYIWVGYASDGTPLFTGTSEYLEFETEAEAEAWLDTVNPLGIATNFDQFEYGDKDLIIDWI